MNQRKLILSCVLGMCVFLEIYQMTAATPITDEELDRAAEREIAAKVKQMSDNLKVQTVSQPDITLPIPNIESDTITNTYEENTSSETECDPTIPYVFLDATTNQGLELTQCIVDESGANITLYEPELSLDLIKMIQQHLINMGFDVGRPDGIIGNKTVNAIHEFQASQNLNVDGEITFSLLDSLQNLALELKNP